MEHWGVALARAAISRLAFVCWLVVGVGSAPAHAEKRVALVIGNGAYANAPRLPNPKNDAEDVAAALKRTGFETIVGLDLDKNGMDDITIRFARAAREADVAIFYYSGHAMQFQGINYLMPVDARLTDEADLRRMARVDEIVADVQQAKNLRILVLDSCRDNPLAEQLKRSVGATRSGGFSRGLAKIDSPQGMIVAYSTQAGRTADDGKGRNSPYTSAFLKHIEAQEEIGTVFRRVSFDVYNETKQQQLPELSLSLIGEFYLRGKPAIAVAPVQPPAPAPPPAPKPSPAPTNNQAALSAPSRPPLPSAPVTDCDRLAASPFDNNRPVGVDGVEIGKIDTERAASACSDAMRQYPDAPRFVAHAGRVASAKKDHAAAFEFYTKAAAMGDLAGMSNLGASHEFGEGTAKNIDEALRLYEKAAAAGDALAMNNLGVVYRDGRDVPADLEQAKRWFGKAAGAGNRSAMLALGRMHWNGQGGPQDLVEAKRWLEKAAEAGNPDAMHDLAYFLSNVSSGEQNRPEARRWLTKAIDLGHSESMVFFGRLHRDGHGVPKDMAEARRWFEKAAAMGNVAAMKELVGVYKWGGPGVPRNIAEAKRWWVKAAELGDESSMFFLGELLDPLGEVTPGMPKNAQEAIYWYKKNVEAVGCRLCMLRIGLIYMAGARGVSKDLGEAKRWFEQAAAAGDDEAKEKLKLLAKKR